MTDNEGATMGDASKAERDPNPLATGPTKWRAEHCVTHHHACDCREWEHAERVGQLEADADDYREAIGELVLRLASAEAELAALRERVEAAPAVEVREWQWPDGVHHVYAIGNDFTGENYATELVGQRVRLLPVGE